MSRRIITEADVDPGAEVSRSWVWPLAGLSVLGVFRMAGFVVVRYLLPYLTPANGGPPPNVSATPTERPTTGTPAGEETTAAGTTAATGQPTTGETLTEQGTTGTSPTTGSPAEGTLTELETTGAQTTTETAFELPAFDPLVLLLGVLVLVLVLVLYSLVSDRTDSSDGEPAPSPGGSEAARPASGSVDATAERVLKTIPLEIVSGWVALQGLIETIQIDDPEIWYWTFFAMGLVATPLHMWHNTREAWTRPLREDLVRIGQITLATVSFVVWVLSLGGPFRSFPFYNQGIGSLVLISYTYWLLPLLQQE